MSRGAIGLDFGTTNTVIAQVDGEGRARARQIHHAGQTLSTFASALAFHEVDEGRVTRLVAEAGPWAIDRFLTDPLDCRFLQSLKSFAASRLFEGTAIYERYVSYDQLLGNFFAQMQRHQQSTNTSSGPVIVGRPVQFVSANPDAELALKRYRAALASVGLTDLYFVYEPVAAAFYYATRLEADATVLVADFGGGTTDYSIMRFSGAGKRAQALSNAGAAVAGDRFDYRIIDRALAPLLGKGSSFRSESQRLPIPDACYARFASWHWLSVLANTREFRDLKTLLPWAEQPEALRSLIDLVESGYGFALYQAVSGAKSRLSSVEQTDLVIDTPPFRAQLKLIRSDFDTWIEDDLAQMQEALDEAMTRAQLKPHQIDRVFLTGGTSFVPAVRNLFIRQFGANKIESGDEFESIANGLALIGEREDLERWLA